MSIMSCLSNFFKKDEELIPALKEYTYISNRLSRNELIKRLRKYELIFRIKKIAELNIQKIYHLSDIHIYPLKRHKQYQEVFEKLYAYKDPNGIFVICGDIFDSKTKITPELIQLSRNFITKLTKESLGVILIAGNHDLHEQNLDRLDNISGVFFGLHESIPNFYYLRESGIYDFGNILFCVDSLIDRKFVRKRSIDLHDLNVFNQKFKVGLYHGTLYKSSSFNGYQFEDKCIPLKYFEDFDITLLGDIHKHQYLNSQKNIAYSGSLIQQNFGESIDGHGMICWDIPSRTSEFIEIKGVEAFITTEIQYINNKFTINYKKIKEYPYVYLRILINTQIPYNKIQKLEEKLYHKFPNIQNIYIEYLHNFQNNYQPLQITNKSFIDYFKLIDIPNDKLSKILSFHNKILTENTETQETYSNHWKLDSIKFNNTLIYGGNHTNYLDFTNKSGIISITGDNAIGKTSILKLILYGLFSGKEAGSFPINIIRNYNSQKYFLELQITSGNDKYLITKNGSKYNNNRNNIQTGQTETIVFKKLVNNEWSEITEENQNGSTITETKSFIKKFLGFNYQDFIGSNVYSHTFSKMILELKNTELLNYYKKRFNLEIFDKYHKSAKNKLGKTEKENIVIQNNILNTEKLITEISQKKLDNQISAILAENTQLNTEITNLTEKLNKYKFQKNKIINKFTGTSENTQEYIQDKLKKIKEQYGKYFNKIGRSSKELQTEKLKLQKDIYEINTDYKDAELPWIFSEDLNITETEIKTEIGNPNSQDRFPEMSLRELLQIYNSQKTFLNSENISDISDKVQNRRNIRDKILKGKGTENDIKKYLQTEEEYSTIFVKYQNLSYDSEKVIESIQKKIYQLETYRNIIQYRKNQKINQQIKIIDQEIKYNKYSDELKQIKIKTKYHDIDQNIFYLSHKIGSYETQIKANQNIIKGYQNELEKLKEFEGQLREFKRQFRDNCELAEIIELYLNSTKSSGIPFEILKENLKKIKCIVNELLGKFTDFTFNFILEKERNIQLKFFANKKNTNLMISDLSGYETFILNIALKLSLVKCSSRGRGLVMFIDEGLDCIDSKNRGKLKEFFEMLKKEFNHIFLISHIPDFHQYQDHSINISRFGENAQFSKAEII